METVNHDCTITACEFELSCENKKHVVYLPLSGGSDRMVNGFLRGPWSLSVISANRDVLRKCLAERVENGTSPQQWSKECDLFCIPLSNNWCNPFLISLFGFHRDSQFRFYRSAFWSDLSWHPLLLQIDRCFDPKSAVWKCVFNLLSPIDHCGFVIASDIYKTFTAVKGLDVLFLRLFLVPVILCEMTNPSGNMFSEMNLIRRDERGNANKRKKENDKGPNQRLKAERFPCSQSTAACAHNNWKCMHAGLGQTVLLSLWSHRL